MVSGTDGVHLRCYSPQSRNDEDVDTLARRFGKAIALYVVQSYLMRSRDILLRLLAYNLDHFHESSQPQRVLPSCSFSSSSSVKTTTAPLNSFVNKSADLSFVVLYHITIIVSPAIPNSTLPRLSNRSDTILSPFAAR